MKTMHKRILAVLLALCFCVLLIPNVSGAAVSGADAFVSEVREKMIARETEIGITLDVTQAELEADYGGGLGAYLDAFFDALYEGVFAHDGTLKGGDYLKKHVGVSSFGGNMLTFTDGVWHCPLTLTVEYYTTAAQEKELDKKLDGILKAADEEIGLSGLSDYEKIRWAYDYICSHVAYDNANLNNDAYTLKYSAYAALVNGTAVCQGYANLFYLMMQRLGVDARIITGLGDGEAHAWNIVKIGSLYYLCDSTWDVGAKTYRWFLRGSKYFENHKADSEFSEKPFTEAFPISETDYDITHKHTPAKMEPVEATCTQAGSQGGVYCTGCGVTLEEPTVIPALGHNFGRWIELSAPTCTLPGKEKGFCSRCPETDIRPVQALGHDYIAHESKAPTCTEIGWDAYNTCSRCDYTAYVEIPALGHDMNGRTEVIAAATVTQAGTLRTWCTRCEYYEDSEIAMTDPTENKPGDVDGNGKVDTSDARLALRRAIGLEKYPEGSCEFKACDVNRDNKVGTDDARFILRHAIGLTDAGIIW